MEILKFLIWKAGDKWERVDRNSGHSFENKYPSQPTTQPTTQLTNQPTNQPTIPAQPKLWLSRWC
jgi:hypothetical protein